MNGMLLRARRLFDGCEWLEPSDGVAVVIQGEQILYAGPISDAPAGCHSIVDLDDCTLLPGLIDMHVHMTMDGSVSSVDQTLTDSQSTAMLRAVKNAQELIRNGITTVRDCGCQGDMALQLKHAVNTGLNIRSPRVFACGQVLCITGGHGSFIGKEVDGPDEARKGAREMLKAGVDFLKVISTGGVISKGTQTGAVQLDADEIAAVVQEARKVGVPTVTHAHGTEGIKIALSSGIGSIEHASYVDEEGVSLFLQTGAFFTSTLLASQLQLDHADELPDYMAKKIRAHMDREHASVRRLIAAGVPALGGTDAGTPFNPHGALCDQLIILKDHGLTNVQALQASTSLAARALGQAGRLGELKPGCLADIIAVTENPKEDLSALKSVCAVWRGGQTILQNGFWMI